ARLNKKVWQTVVLSVLIAGVVLALSLWLTPRQQPSGVVPGGGELGSAPGPSPSGPSAPVQSVPPPPGFPPTAGGLALVEVKEGREALAEISRLHGTQIEGERGWILTYSDGRGRAVVWISEAKDEGVAREQVAEMLKKMEKSKTFTPPQPLGIPTVEMYQTSGLNQMHFFWAKGRRVYWVSADQVADLMPVMKDVLHKM
ncbi:MAG: hypothetical protein QJR13_00735, partial [Bacillota bacterium]|nr:hypothetical protein [Bacillota bacterium]